MYAEGCKDSVVSVKEHPCDNTTIFDCISATNDNATIDNTILRFVSDGIRYFMISWGNSRMHKWKIPVHFSVLLYGLGMKLEVLDLKCEYQVQDFLLHSQASTQIHVGSFRLS